jgi:hypothetical protein
MGPECRRNAGSEVGIEIHRGIEAALGLSTTKHRKIARKVVWRVSSRRRTKPLRSKSPRRNSAMICRKGEITTGDLRREWLHHLALSAEKVRCFMNSEAILCAAGVQRLTLSER